MTKETRFAKAMSELLFTMRHSSMAEVDGTTEEQRNTIADDPLHKCEIKLHIFKHIFEDVTNYPQNFEQDENGEYVYTIDVYDYCYSYDIYIEELVKKERQSKLKITYRIVLSIVRVETDEEGNADELECDCPVSILDVPSYEMAELTVKSIQNSYPDFNNTL